MVTKEVEKHGSRNIKLGTILGYINLVLSISTGLLYTPWIKNTIGVGNYGLYTLSTSLINLFLLDFGLSTTINTFLSRYRAAEDEESIKGFLGVVYKIFFIIDFFVFASFLLVYFFIDVIYGGLTAQEILEFKKIFLVAALFSVVSFPCTVFTGVLQSYEEYIAIKIKTL